MGDPACPLWECLFMFGAGLSGSCCDLLTEEHTVQLVQICKASALKPPLHRAATFVPPLSDQKNGQDAQWSPKPRKFCFCVTAAARPLCLPWTTKSAVMAQQVAEGGRVEAEPLPRWLKGCRGRRMEAQWSPLWSLNGRYRLAKGGTMVVQGRQKRCSNWYTMFTTVRIFYGRPMADHCASILPPWRCMCLPPASFERPVSDRPPRRPLCDCFEHAQNFTATMASMAMSERPVYHHWATKATVLPPFCLQRRPGQFCGRTMEAERSQPLCKDGISYRAKPVNRSQKVLSHRFI